MEKWNIIYDPKDGDEVVFVGVHALRWKPEWGMPTVAFYRTYEQDDEVTISKAEYDRLLESETWLGCLNAAGVDNWQGIDVAVDMLEELDGDD